MKKTYIKPESTLHRIEIHHLCTLSMNSATKANSDTTVLSRESSNWDDEEDW